MPTVQNKFISQHFCCVVIRVTILFFWVTLCAPLCAVPSDGTNWLVFTGNLREQGELLTRMCRQLLFQSSKGERSVGITFTSSQQIIISVYFSRIFWFHSTDFEQVLSVPTVKYATNNNRVEMWRNVAAHQPGYDCNTSIRSILYTSGCTRIHMSCWTGYILYLWNHRLARLSL